LGNLLVLVMLMAQQATARDSASADAVRERLTTQPTSAIVADGQSLHTSLVALYASRAHAPLWIDRSGQPTRRARVLLEEMRLADRRGLSPRDYEADALTSLAASLPPGGPVDARAGFDLALSTQAMRMAWHLQRGRIDPRKLDFALPPRSDALDLAAVVGAMATGDIGASLDALEPPFAGYRRLRGGLVRALDLQRDDTFSGLPPIPGRVLEPGQAYEGAAALAQRLVQLGDLEEQSHGRWAGSATAAYDGELVAAVERFQDRHGLLVDGRIGGRTFAELQVPLLDRVRQMTLALERWRWVPVAFAQPPIVVNIPEFVLRAMADQGQVALRSRVVVGAAFERQTPIFAEALRSVVFRPYWNVPTSILRRDLLPRARKDPGYFQSHGYELVGEADQTLTPERLDGVRRGRIAVRQRPGDGNALGKVKFLFPNNHAVYLHDTPARGLFARARRDFSSGCIRVENPAELAAWVLRNDPAWTLERIQSAMDSGPDNQAVRVEPAIPVFLVYVTALAPASGELRFFEDIYGHDAALAKALGLPRGETPLRE
jgi:murein L,D-transpeptidase YcbB/YkuD